MSLKLESPPPESLDAVVDSFGVTARLRSRVGTGQALAIASAAAVAFSALLVVSQMSLYSLLVLPVLGGLWFVRRPRVVAVRPDGVRVGRHWIPAEEVAGAQVVSSKVFAEEGVEGYLFLQITTRRPWRTIEIPATLHSRADLEWLSAAIRSVSTSDGEIDAERAAQSGLEDEQRAFRHQLSDKT